MLPAANRLTRSQDFVTVLRRGRRSGGETLVLHLLERPDELAPRAGFVVSKAVGGAVVRNRVARRLRAQVAARLALLPAGALLVVRAQPAAAEASSARLGADLDRALRRLLPVASTGAPA